MAVRLWRCFRFNHWMEKPAEECGDRSKRKGSPPDCLIGSNGTLAACLPATEYLAIPLTAIRKVDCLDCHGKGEIKTGRWTDRGQLKYDKIVPCPRCLGSGKLNEFTLEEE